MKRVRFPLVALLGLGIVLLAAHGREPKKNDLMRQKLEHSQKVLEGVAVGDFKMIQRHGEGLLEISKKVGWKVLNTPAYEVHTNSFRRSAETLIQNAKEKNLDAAALTYVDLTLTCVKCHKHVRDVRMTSLD